MLAAVVMLRVLAWRIQAGGLKGLGILQLEMLQGQVWM